MKIDVKTTYDAIFPVYQQVIGAQHLWKAISDIAKEILGKPVEDSHKLRDFAYGLVTIIPVVGTIFNLFLYNVVYKTKTEVVINAVPSVVELPKEEKTETKAEVKNEEKIEAKVEEAKVEEKKEEVKAEEKKEDAKVEDKKEEAKVEEKKNDAEVEGKTEEKKHKKTPGEFFREFSSKLPKIVKKKKEDAVDAEAVATTDPTVKAEGKRKSIFKKKEKTVKVDAAETKTDEVKTPDEAKKPKVRRTSVFGKKKHVDATATDGVATAKVENKKSDEFVIML